DGPLKVTLRATDNLGLTRQSESIVIPHDPNIAPIESLSVSKIVKFATPPPYNSTLFVQALDIFGRPVPNAGVSFTLLSTTTAPTISTLYNVTDSQGLADMKLTWGGTGQSALVGATTGRAPT